MTQEQFMCDICGKERYGSPFVVYDENYREQRGLKQCGECFTLAANGRIIDDHEKANKQR